MRVCSSCGRENPDDRDFCDCGEYLRWDPTGVVHAVDGVEFVKILRIYETNLQTGEQSSKPAGSHIVLEPDELLASAQHIVKATHRET